MSIPDPIRLYEGSRSANPEATRLTWRDVLDCKNGIRYGHVSVMWRMARMTGYAFIAWNGRVWSVDEDGANDLGITTDAVDDRR